MKKIFVLLGLTLLASIVAAQGAPDAFKAPFCQGANLMRYVVGGLAILAIMWNGAKLIPFAGGEVSAEDRESAKKGIIFTIAGAIIVILAPALVGYFISGVPTC